MEYRCQKYTVDFFHLDYRMGTLSVYAPNEHKLVTIAQRRARHLRHAGKHPTHIRVNGGHRIDVPK